MAQHRRHAVSRYQFAFLVFGLISGSACGPPPTTPDQNGAETLSLRTETSHFRILTGDAVERATWTNVVDRLNANYSRVLGDLAVTSLPVVTVKIWSNQTAFLDELERTLGTRYQSAGYVVPGNELRILVVDNVAVNAVHEFCHVATLALQPGSGNNPRWLWESVALFENGELVDTRTLPYYASGAFPTLAQLNSTVDVSTEVYRLGYLIGEFIVTTFGHDKLLALIRSFGDVPGVLAIPVAEFEQRFAAYVRSRP